MFGEAPGRTHLSGNNTALKIRLKGHVFLIMAENIGLFFFLQKMFLSGKLKSDVSLFVGLVIWWVRAWASLRQNPSTAPSQLSDLGQVV